VWTTAGDAPVLPDPVLDLLRRAPQLAGLCTQNGWIDNDTLVYEVLADQPGRLLLAVQFEEIVMEGAGCVADRKACYGRVEVIVTAAGVPQGIRIP
jgi:hypothetical protein